MSKVTKFYIEHGFAKLAGPYNTCLPQERYFLERVIDDMRRGNIEHRVVHESDGMFYVERTGMILSEKN